MVWDGSSDADGTWVAFTPTFSGSVVGSGGTLTGRYLQLQKTVKYRINLVLGSTGLSIGSNMFFGFPVATASSYALGDPMGRAFMVDTSVGSGSRLLGELCWVSTAQGFLITAKDTAPTVTATSPWTWAVGDVVSIAGEYEAA